MKKRILFVDDDPQLLTSIKRMLWNMQDRWELFFALSGDQALDMLSKQPHDVLVTDMRMSGMDGRFLLRAVREKYPWMMRLILSGDSDRLNIMHSVPEAHQFLTKPVMADRLIEVVDRGCRLRDMILSDELKALIGHIGALPVLPKVYAKLLKELENESSTVDILAHIISRDVALSADVLKLVNSSFFGPRMRVRSVDQAVTLLGTETIKGLVLGVQMLKKFDTKKLPEISFPRLWEHCLTTARLARRIAQMENLSPEVQDECFIAGMLHDLGKYVLAEKLHPRYKETVEMAHSSNITISEAEQHCLGASHAQVGAYLLGLWGMPDAVLEAVALHHEPATLGLTSMSPVTAVHAANVLEHQLVVINPGYATHPIDYAYLEQLGLKDRYGHWTSECREVIAEGDAQ